MAVAIGITTICLWALISIPMYRSKQRMRTRILSPASEGPVIGTVQLHKTPACQACCMTAVNLQQSCME